MVSSARVRAPVVTGPHASRVGIIAALPGELAPLVRGWTRVDAGENIHQWERDAIQKDGNAAKWIAVCAGIGREAATRAFAAAEKDGPLTAVLSIGWAGALSADISPGTVLLAGWVIDAQTGERFTLAATSGVGLITAGRVAGTDEKVRLAAAYPAAQLVDMEAATVARLASIRSIPAYCWKGVSDAMADSLPDLNPFIDARGQFHTARFIASVAIQPQYWSALRSFGATSKKAAHELGASVRQFLEKEKANVPAIAVSPSIE